MTLDALKFRCSNLFLIPGPFSDERFMLNPNPVIPTFSFFMVFFSTQREGSSHRNLLWPCDDDDCSERYAAERDVVVYDVACPDRSLVQHRKLELEELCFALRTGIGGIVAREGGRMQQGH